MSLNKKILAAAVVSGLFATAANAQVTLGSPATTQPVTVASEAFGSAHVTAGALFTNAANALNLRTPLSYAFSNGEVRYARIECGSNVRFHTDSAVTYSDATVGTATLGAINGLGTNVIFFSVTATSVGVGDNINDVFTVTGSRNILPGVNADCSYSLYDQPSQAQAGGTTGRITTTSGAYTRSASGYLFATNSQQVLTADVEASTGAFTRFIAGGPVSATLGRLTNLRHDVATGIQIDKDGLDIELVDIFGAATNITVTGDFSFVTGAANVFLATDDACTAGVVAANSVSATQAVFTVGNLPRNAGADVRLCVIPNSSTAIPAGSYTATLNAVVSNATLYSVSSTGPLAAGSIVRNGTSIQAPLAQVPGGYLSRLVLTNTGNLDRPFTISVFGETGNVIGTANLTGTVPANGTIVRDLTTVLTSFTGAPRATLNVTIAGPNNQIQGLYQIVNPTTGSISNHVMVRPGTN